MKKFLCLILCLLSISTILLSCSKPCSHEYSDGACTKCSEACTHAFENGVCSVCNMTCSHNFANGICSICNMPCEHKFVDSVCSICNIECSHDFSDGVCTICNKKCSHHFPMFKNECDICGLIGISSKDLNGRTFKYSYFELDWSEDATESEKENLKKRFHAESDTQVFDKIREELNIEILMIGIPHPYTLKFSTESVHMSGGLTITDSNSFYGIRGNTINTSYKKVAYKFYYENDKIYCLEQASAYKGIQIKYVYTES